MCYFECLQIYFEGSRRELPSVKFKLTNTYYNGLLVLKKFLANNFDVVNIELILYLLKKTNTQCKDSLSSNSPTKWIAVHLIAHGDQALCSCHKCGTKSAGEFWLSPSR